MESQSRLSLIIITARSSSGFYCAWLLRRCCAFVFIPRVCGRVHVNQSVSLPLGFQRKPRPAGAVGASAGAQADERRRASDGEDARAAINHASLGSNRDCVIPVGGFPALLTPRPWCTDGSLQEIRRYQQNLPGISARVAKTCITKC